MLFALGILRNCFIFYMYAIVWFWLPHLAFLVSPLKGQQRAAGPGELNSFRLVL